MINPPKTREEAEKRQYGGNAATGSPSHPYNPKRCAYEVSEPGRGFYYFQCKRKPCFGAAGLYCAQHAKQVPAEGDGETKWIVSIRSRFNVVSLMEATVLNVTEATVTVTSYKNLFNSGWLNKGRNNLSTSDTTLIVCDDLQSAKNRVANTMKQWVAMKRQEIANIEASLEEVAKL